MKDVIKNSLLILLILLLLSCVQATREEAETLIKLKAEFNSYEFSKHGDLSDAYLRIKVVEPVVDSVELKAIYEAIDKIKNNATIRGEPHINWMYLVVFNRDNEYLFTIVKNDSIIIFFGDAVR